MELAGGNNQIVYSPEERLNKLADDVDRDAPLSRMTLFSPCKVIIFYSFELTFVSFWLLNYMLNLIAYVVQVNVFLRITNKREDGFHDLASLFHVSLA